MVLAVEAPPNETEILRKAVAGLTERLPARWALQTFDPTDLLGRRADAAFRITAPDGRTATLAVQVKGTVEGRDVPGLAEQFAGSAKLVPNAQPLVAARYLTPQVRAQLSGAGLNYLDATGNVQLSLSDPGLFLSDKGLDKDPWRGPGRPRGTLKGEPAARVVRTLADFGGAWKVRELVGVARVSTGAGYRVIDFLEREGLAIRGESSTISVPDWRALLRRWSQDYSFADNARTSRWIAPRGLDDLQKRAATSDGPTYAMTGTLAAAEWAAYAPARSAMIYTVNADETAAAWGLRPTEAGANVVLAEPDFNIAYERSLTTSTGLQIAAPTQVVVDLMTGPGRSPAEAEHLLQWMEKNERSWRK
ncbi:hypothetical protein [Rudaeicoccus suwonensis]|uniref:Transcriptional regulator with AbiEi antitoxin domain of type IV toxin-antitoxin system n=1 Tax=Rudaeicoccus suwonensis TaxID=657409 RepID=A0A561E6L6_9MICO|nr:hypothetical protein [Rudaeicoccus suwonensis]TWE11242.1 hypothetical protein BKA23_0004 [Rudaeicoccus suwonensis]